MFLRSFAIDHFGVFTDQRVDALPAGLTVIHGSNEAGKSTCLNFFRSLFFGFNRCKGQNDFYLAGAGSCGMAGGSLGLECRHGSLTLVRRPGKKKDGEAVLLAADGTEVQGLGLADLLGGCTPEAFESVFAFSLGELLDIGDKKDERIQYALHGAAFGSVRSPAEVIRKLTARAKAIHTPGGKVTVVRDILNQLEQVREQRRLNGLETERYIDLHTRLQNLERQYAEAEAQLAQHDAHRRRLERLYEAWPAWERYLAATDELALLPVVEGECGEEAARRVSRLMEGLETCRTARHAARTKALRLREEVAALLPACALLDLRSDVDALRSQSPTLIREAEELPGLLQNRKALASEAADICVFLGSSWDLKRLADFSPGLDVEESCRSIGDSLVQAETAEAEARSEAERARRVRDDAAFACERSRESLEKQGASKVPETDFAPALAAAEQAVSALPAKLATRERARQGLTEAAARLEAILDRCQVLDEDLARVMADTAAPSDGAAEDPTCLIRARRLFAARPDLVVGSSLPDWRRNRDQTREWEYTAQAADLRVAQAEDQVNRLNRQAPEDDTRRRTLAYLSLLASGLFLPGAVFFRLVQPSELLTWLCLALGVSCLAVSVWLGVLAWGRARDRRIHTAFLKDALGDLSRAEAERDAARERLAAIPSGQGKKQGEGIAAYWVRCCLLAEEALAASQALESVRSIADRASELENECADLFARVRTCATIASRHPDLAATLDPHEADLQTIAAALTELGRGWQRIQEGRIVRLRREQSLTDRITALEAAERAVEVADAALARLAERTAHQRGLWQQWLEQFALPPALSPAGAHQALARVVRGRECLRTLDEIDQRLDARKTRLQKFAAQLTTYCQAADIPIAQYTEPQVNDLMSHLSRLSTLVEAERDKAIRHEALTRELAEAEDSLRALDSESTELEAALQAVLQAAGAADPAQFAARHEQWRRREAARLDYELAERQVVHAADFLPGGLTEMAEAFRDMGREELARQLESAVTVAGQAADHLRELAEARGRAKAGLDGLCSENGMMMLRAKEETLLESLHAEGREWARLTLALALLDRAKSAFESRRQPGVVRRAGDLFAAITGGAYQAITISLDNKFRAVTASGEARDPETQLSRGTREQLYLALRLAYIEDYGSDGGAEKLPVIMDDILVNFDRVRAEKTAHTLGEVAKTNQILFFTCHESTADSLCQAVPDALRLRVDKGVIRPE